MFPDGFQIVGKFNSSGFYTILAVHVDKQLYAGFGIPGHNVVGIVLSEGHLGEYLFVCQLPAFAQIRSHITGFGSKGAALCFDNILFLENLRHNRIVNNFPIIRTQLSCQIFMREGTNTHVILAERHAHVRPNASVCLVGIVVVYFCACFISQIIKTTWPHPLMSKGGRTEIIVSTSFQAIINFGFFVVS